MATYFLMFFVGLIVVPPFLWVLSGIVYRVWLWIDDYPGSIMSVHNPVTLYVMDILGYRVRYARPRVGRFSYEHRKTSDLSDGAIAWGFITLACAFFPVLTQVVVRNPVFGILLGLVVFCVFTARSIRRSGKREGSE